MELDDFREDAEQWLKENCPPSLRGRREPVSGGGRKQPITDPDSQRYFEAMLERGWTVPHWPTEYGGAGLDAEAHFALRQAMSDVGAPLPLAGMGTTMIGPTLLEHGTREQKARHLPKIASGEIRWCQGYSEPGAGSDLASLSTRATDEGDHYLVNGSKIWTSGAQYADWIFCLVRTDFDAPKHEGISFLLFSMDQPGVSVKPIRLISGASPFCQCFFDDARALKEDLVGKQNRGWTIAKRLLQHERQMISGIGGISALGGSGRRLQDVAKEYAGEDGGRIADPALRSAVTRQQINDQAFQYTLQRAGEEARSGQADGNLASIFKYYGTEQNKRKYELLLAAMGTRSLGWDGAGFDPRELGITRAWLRSKANSIEGGTSEVQLNVIAKRVLGLPD
jgi:alkylation response protein AidB-like acyl-CoA dehydrogenase